MDDHLRFFGSLQPPDSASLLSVSRFDGVTTTLTFDRNILALGGSPWSIQILSGGTWRNSDAPTTMSGATCRCTYGGASVNIGNSWRLLTDNGQIGFPNSTPVSNPCSGLIV